MNLQEFRALDEFQRSDVLKELAGDELKAFAREVAGDQAPMLLRIVNSPNANDATIKNLLKIEFRKLSLAFQERQTDMQLDAVEQPQEEFNWERIKGAPFIEKKPTPINEAAKDEYEAAKNEFLKQFYEGEIVDIDTTNPLANIQAVRAQIEAVCQKMVGYGFRNFNGLKDKFADMAFNIEGVEQRQRDFSNAKQIKQVMESILYCVENKPEASRTEFVANYKDTQFACSDGSLQNLNDILSEMESKNADIAAYVAWAKRKAVFSTFVPMYRQNFFHEAGLVFHPRNGNEMHDIDSLINAVADEFGMVVRTQEEDRFIKDASRYREFLLGELNRFFARPEVLKNISTLVAGKIFANLKGDIDTKLPIKDQVQDFLVKLGLGDKYNYFHLVNDKGGKLKNIAPEIVGEIVTAYFHEQGILEVLDIKLVYQFLKTAGSHNAQYEQVVTRENFPEEAEGDREAVKLVLFQDLELDEVQFETKNQVLYFARKNKNLFAEFNLGRAQLELLLKDVSAEELKDIEIPASLLHTSLFFVTTPEQIDVLVSKGADTKIVNLAGYNAAKHSEAKGSQAVVEKFAELGISPINVFEGHENGIDPKREEMIVNTLSIMPKWLGVDNLSKIIECGMVNALRKALETPKGRESLLLLDKDGNTALLHAALHLNPVMFLEIIKTAEGRRTIAHYNNNRSTPVEELIVRDRVELINEVLKTPEGAALINGGNGNKSFVELAYEHKRYDFLRTLLKCNISLDPIMNSDTDPGLLEDAIENEDFKAFEIFMERAELRNLLFSNEASLWEHIDKLQKHGLLKSILQDHWREILKSAGDSNLFSFVKVAAACGLLNEIIDKLDKEDHKLLSKILNALVSDNTPISSELDEALSATIAKNGVKKWVVEVHPDKPMGMHFKRLVAKGATKTVEAILNDDFARRSIFFQDKWGHNFLHCGAYNGDGDIAYYGDNYDLLNCEDGDDDYLKSLLDQFYRCINHIADNPCLKSALPRLLAIQGIYGKTALNLAAEEMPVLFKILLDWSTRPENILSLHILDNDGRTPFYNALLRCYDISIMTKFVNADASFVNSIFDDLDNEMVNVISRILDDDVERIRGDEVATVAFGNVFEFVKDNPVLMRKFIDSVGNESECSALEYARRYDMPIIVNAILTFAQDTSLGLSLPSASLETQASASTALIHNTGAEATISIPTSVTSKVGARKAKDLDDDEDHDDKTEEYKRRRKGESPDR